MAGSQPEVCVVPSFSDPILAARVEAIRQLAGGISDRVAVMDREFNVVYANSAAWAGRVSDESRSHPAKCYQAFADRTDPCGTCPATKVFQTTDVQSVSCGVEGDGTACGMHQAFPLVAGDGQVSSMLVLFSSSSKPVIRPVFQEADDRPSPMVREHLGDLIGRSAAMQQLFDMIALVAESQATVLIQGESGTGKELVAKTIHRLSDRRDKPFVVVDCGSLPETLLESELFGHMKGSFTGATANKRGLFEDADGGTIFLDEIADTTPTFQAKLLRVLQEGEVKRVGGNQPVKVDVRVVSATNKDLNELVKVRAFRQDLYYRLAVLPLALPPLRERREDIPLLVEQFIVVSCQRHRQPPRTVSSDVVQALSEAAWPGNVRELQHYIERAVVTTTGPDLMCGDIVALGAKAPEEGLRTVVRDAVSLTERTRIVEALRKTGGNRLRAAKLLKISRAGLYNKLREYGLQ
ncbi:MAG: sigma-54-dependent Fis family transcriptional regulator [Nitrospira sp.]|nr:sigma-54-dependent Fis family transcriptional regulator [Nitrospira sp.]